MEKTHGLFAANKHASSLRCHVSDRRKKGAVDKNVVAQHVVERTIEVGERLRAVELDELGSETTNLRDKPDPEGGVCGLVQRL